MVFIIYVNINTNQALVKSYLILLQIFFRQAIPIIKVIRSLKNRHVYRCDFFFYFVKVLLKLDLLPA